MTAAGMETALTTTSPIACCQGIPWSRNHERLPQSRRISTTIGRIASSRLGALGCRTPVRTGPSGAPVIRARYATSASSMPSASRVTIVPASPRTSAAASAIDPIAAGFPVRSTN